MKYALVLIPVIMLAGCGDTDMRDLLRLKAVKTVEKTGGDSFAGLLAEAEKLERSRDAEDSRKLGVLYEKIGMEYTAKSAWDPAIEAFTRAIGRGNASSRVHYHLGASYANRGMAGSNEADFRKALEHYHKALSLDPRSTETRYGIALTEFYGLKNTDAGLAAMEEVVKSGKTNTRAAFALGRMQYEKGNLDQSLKVYQDIHAYLNTQPAGKLRDQQLADVRENISRVMKEMAER